LAIDEDRVTSGTAKGGIFRDDFYSFRRLKIFKNLERFWINDLQIQRSRVGVDEEFFDKLPSDPGNPGKLACLPEPFDNFPPDFNGSILSARGSS
jgi:hypothetical protein